MEFGFFFKKLITFFVEPLGVVFTLFGLGLYLLFINKKNPAKLFLSLACGTLFLFSYPPFSNYLVKQLEEQYPKYEYANKIEYIHVLGSGHNVDSAQPISSQISGAGVKRVLEGVILHKQIEGSKLIFTGYEGETNRTTAQMHASLALALGVKEENIIVNGMPKDTQEGAVFTKNLLSDAPFVLVTSASHMPRARQLFKSLGLSPIAAPTDFQKSEFRGFLREPTIDDFKISQKAMHEYIGILWMKIRS